MIHDITINWPSAIEFGVGRIEILKEHLPKSGRILIISDPNLVDRVDGQVKK